MPAHHPQHPPATVARILELPAAGLTRAQIASRVTGLTRSAICGVLHRAGVKAPKRTAKPKPPDRPRHAYIRKAKPSQPEPVNVSDEHYSAGRELG